MRIMIISLNVLLKHYLFIFLFLGAEKEMVTIDIPIKKIVTILAHFGRSLPVFYVYVKPSMGSTIRTATKMKKDHEGFYFDPCSLGKYHVCNK